MCIESHPGLLCRCFSDWNHEEGRRHTTRLHWEARGWDWSRNLEEMDEADRREEEDDWDWEPEGIGAPLQVRDVTTPLMDRAQAEELDENGEYKLYKREIVE